MPLRGGRIGKTPFCRQINWPPHYKYAFSVDPLGRPQSFGQSLFDGEASRRSTRCRRVERLGDHRIGCSNQVTDNPTATMTLPNRVILIPGLLEPRLGMFPLWMALRSDIERVEFWRDRIAFRNVEASVDRLAGEIAGDAAKQDGISLVTHSFGDWVARAAIARSPSHRVVSMVSLAPVMRSGFFPTLAYAATCNLIPEIKIIMDRVNASANLNCDPKLRRLVIWSRFDESLRSIALDHIPNLRVERVFATHLTIGWQPNVLKLVTDFCVPSSDARF